MNEAVEATTTIVQNGFTLSELLGFAMLWLAIATAALFWAVKWLLDRYRDGVNQQFAALGARFDTLDLDLKQDKDALVMLERRMMEMKADLPLSYVRKEDAVRHEAVFNAKLDALAAKIDQYAGRK